MSEQSFLSGDYNVEGGALEPGDLDGIADMLLTAFDVREMQDLACMQFYDHLAGKGLNKEEQSEMVWRLRVYMDVGPLALVQDNDGKIRRLTREEVGEFNDYLKPFYEKLQPMQGRRHEVIIIDDPV